MQQIFLFQDLLKVLKSWCVCNMSSKKVLKTSWRSLQDVFAWRLQDIFKMFWDIFQDVFKSSTEDALQLCLEEVKEKKWRQKNVTLNTSSRPLEDVFSASSPRRMFARSHLEVFSKKGVSNLAKFIRKHLYWSPLF